MAAQAFFLEHRVHAQEVQLNRGGLETPSLLVLPPGCLAPSGPATHLQIQTHMHTRVWV